MVENAVILTCPGCKQRLRVPTNRGALILTCPVCRTRWDWSPGRDDVLYIGEDRTAMRDPGLAEALRIYEAFEAERISSASADDTGPDLWDVDLDGPRPR
jgi:hypothetical protein